MATKQVDEATDTSSSEKPDADKVVAQIKSILKKNDNRLSMVAIATILSKKLSQSVVDEIVKILSASDEETLNVLAEKFLALKGGFTQFKIAANTKTDHELCMESRPNADMIIGMWKIAVCEGIPFQVIFERLLVFQYLKKRFLDRDWWPLTELLWMLRRVFVLSNVNDSKDETRLRRGFETIIAIFENRAGNSQLERKWFGEIGLLGSSQFSGEGRVRGRDDPLHRHIMAGRRLDARHACMMIYESIAILHNAWIQSNNCSEVLREAATTPLKYSDSHRQEILALLENKLSADPPVYLVCLYEEVEKVLFEYIMFGHRKTCGTCGATNRETQLLACKLCKTDKICPKKWYCDIDCQIDDWPKHRGEHAKHNEKKKVEKGASK